MARPKASKWGRMSAELERALTAADWDPEKDAAVVALARSLALVLDETSGNAAVLAKLSPQYRACLTALGMTPAARKAAGAPTVVPSGHLQALRGTG